MSDKRGSILRDFLFLCAGLGLSLLMWTPQPRQRLPESVRYRTLKDWRWLQKMGASVN